MQLSKNALGNLINRYKAVLKKCHLLNTFGSLAVAACLGLTALGAVALPMQAGVAQAAAFDPTLNGITEADAKAIMKASVPTGYTQNSWDAHVDNLVLDISSAYTVQDITGQTPAPGTFFTTFTTVQNGVPVTYGVKLKTPDGGTASTISGIIPRTDAAGDWQIKADTGGNWDFSVGADNFSLYTADGSNPLQQQGSHIDTHITPSSTINQNFIGITYSSGNNQGGAVFNDTHNIDFLMGDFIGNSVTATSGMADGGAMYNNGGIITLMGDFIGNSATSTDNTAEGGAVNNDTNATITTLMGDFIGNSVTSTSSSSAGGGAVYNNGGITTLMGDFIGNNATSIDNTAEGGAVYNGTNATITTLMGDFIGNSATANMTAYGGAVYTSGSITTLMGDFIGNSVTSTFSSSAGGGAVYNRGGISTLMGDFIGNSVTATSGSTADGGAVYTSGSISTLMGDFIDNSVTATKGLARGGAIHNYSGSGTISTLMGDFIGNSAKNKQDNALGGAIFNAFGAHIGSISGSFLGNSVTTLDSAKLAQGGAIWTDASLTFVADGAQHVFSGNYTQVGSGAKDYNAIYIDGAGKSLTFNMQGTGDFVFDDNIKASNNYTVNITGADATKNIFQLNNVWNNASAVTLTNATLSFGTVTHDGTPYSGSIGSASLDVSGTSTLHNTDLSTNAVTFMANSDVTITGAVQLGSSFTNSSSALNLGQVNGSAGTLTLGTNQSLTVGTGQALNVNNGTLALNGTGGLTIEDGGTFSLDSGTFNASGYDFTTESGATLSSTFGTELIVDIDSIGSDATANILGTATVDANTTVDDIQGTVKITGFTSGLVLDYTTDYTTLRQAAYTAFGGANIIFEGVTTNLSGISLTDVAKANDPTLGNYSVTYGEVASGQLATVGSVTGMDGSGVSARNNSGTMTLTGAATDDPARTGIISDGDVQTRGSGITSLGNGSSDSTVQGSVISDSSTTATSITTLHNVTVQENLENLGTGKTIVQSDSSVQGATTLSANAELQAQDATFTAVGTTVLDSGTLRTTSTSSGNNIANASAAFLHNLPNIDGDIIVEQNAYTVLGAGDKNYAQATFNNSKHNWGTGVTAALFIVKPQTLASGGSIMVDGKSTGISAAGNNEAKFTANSLLVVDAANVGSTAALTSTPNGVLTVADSAKLHITGASAGDTVTIVEGFSDASSSIADGGWDEGNLTTSTSLQVVKVAEFNPNDGSYSVAINAATPTDLRSIYTEMSEETINFLPNIDPNDANSYLAALFSDKLGKNAPRETTLRTEGLLRIAHMAGLQSTGLNVGKSIANSYLRRLGDFGVENVPLQSQQVNKDKGMPAGSVEGLSAGQNTQGMKNGMALWISPLYQYSTVQGVDVGNFKNGYESALGGLSLGADYTFNDIFRVGLAFNVGAGYTESTGDFYATNSDFDFWGLSLYGGINKNNFSLMADVGYSSIYGEITQDAGLGFSTLKASTQSDVWMLGLTAAYTIKTDFMDITPHAGVRYMHVTTDAFDTKSNGIVQTHTAESSQDVWYFPVGVTFSKDIVSENGWIFTPKLDVGFLAAAGDLESTTVTSIPGGTGNAEYTMQNVDGFAFNGGLGFDLAHKDNGVSLNLNYNLQMSEHETGHMLSATFRYEF